MTLPRLTTLWKRSCVPIAKAYIDAQEALCACKSSTETRSGSNGERLRSNAYWVSGGSVWLAGAGGLGHGRADRALRNRPLNDAVALANTIAGAISLSLSTRIAMTNWVCFSRP